MAIKLLRFPELSKKLGGRSRSSIFRDMRDRNFPKPISLGCSGHSIAWDEQQIDDWLTNLAQQKYEPLPVAPGARRGRPRKAVNMGGDL